MTPDAELLRDLQDPEAYPPPRPAAVEVRETHLSWVFLTDRDAWKIKKPVNFGFVDYTTPEKRLAFCREEVRLNRRLAPDVYLGVRAVAATSDGLELADERDSRAVDYLVEMRRYDDAGTLPSATTSRSW